LLNVEWVIQCFVEPLEHENVDVNSMNMVELELYPTLANAPICGLDCSSKDQLFP
jgi:hypothetical protein